MTRTILILGGTTEAADIAQALTQAHPDWDVVTALAGRTPDPRPLPGRVLTGGFGGADGLAQWIKDNSVSLLVDCTHPFAAAISDHARIASKVTGVRLLALDRPVWQAQDGDHWIIAPDGSEAARMLPTLGKRPFLTVGTKALAPFLTDPVPWALVRLLTESPPPASGWEVVVGRPPFTPEAEMALMRAHKIDVLVTKQSGGAATSAKLEAAWELSLPVLMIARPPQNTANALPLTALLSAALAG